MNNINDECIEKSDGEQFDPWGKSCVDFNERLLIEGPRSPMRDMHRVFHIFREFFRGFHSFRHLDPCVTFFGSARFHENHAYYQMARVTAQLLAKAGFNIMTGGGPGIMEASNRGALEGGRMSVGCNITLPTEQRPNKYLDKFIEFDHFYVRKVMLLRYSYAFVVMPGGFGTLDEVFETLTLMQTKKISHFPVVLMGQEFWSPLRSFILDTLLKNSTIGKNDSGLLHFTDDPEDAATRISQFAVKNLGLRKR